MASRRAQTRRPCPLVGAPRCAGRWAGKRGAAPREQPPAQRPVRRLRLCSARPGRPAAAAEGALGLEAGSWGPAGGAARQAVAAALRGGGRCRSRVDSADGTRGLGDSRTRGLAAGRRRGLPRGGRAEEGPGSGAPGDGRQAAGEALAALASPRSARRARSAVRARFPACRGAAPLGAPLGSQAAGLSVYLLSVRLPTYLSISLKHRGENERES